MDQNPGVFPPILPHRLKAIHSLLVEWHFRPSDFEDPILLPDSTHEIAISPISSPNSSISSSTWSDLYIPSYHGSTNPFSFAEAPWKAAWRAISEMQGLKSIRVKISGNPWEQAPSEKRVFGPLRRVKGIENFEVEWPWPVSEGMMQMADLPFQIFHVPNA